MFGLGTNRDPILDACLVAANKACIDQRGTEGTDALQVLLKAPMAVSDQFLTREGRAPPRLINQLAIITRKKMGRHGGHPSPKNDIHFRGLQPLAAAELSQLALCEIGERAGLVYQLSVGS